jgi:hypothetical protein
MIRKLVLFTWMSASLALAQKTTTTTTNNDKGGSTTVTTTRVPGSVVKNIEHTNRNGGTGSGQVVKDTDPRDGSLSTQKTYTGAKGRTQSQSVTSQNNGDRTWSRNRTNTGPGGRSATGTATGNRQSGTWSRTGRGGQMRGGSWWRR